ncbi:hypothetical protein L218DRAFT_657165 [Marasmius fiardii PR-910]|nr:hypothetical protein L218DRAFT_657165 [Marasmius fiardii PR-910]
MLFKITRWQPLIGKSVGIDVSSMNINYFQKFDGYQQALRRAFSHHPALSESFSAPSNPVKNVDSSKTEEHWETRIDSLVSQFQAPPSTSPDSSESPTGSPLSQTPSPHPLPQSAGHPRGLPLQSTRDKLKSSPRSYEVSSRTLHQFSSEFYQHRSANYGAHLEELPRPPTLPPSYLPSRRPLAGSSPSFQLTPPAAHGLTTALTLDSLLSHSTTILVFDLADDTFNPTPIGPPPDVHNDMASSPSSRASLLVPATSPPVSSIRLVLDDDDFVKPTSTIGLSQLEVKAVSSVSVRVTDVLEELYRALNHRITRSEWSQLNAEEKQHVSWEFYKRCSRSSQEQNVRDDGVKKVDFAKRTKLRCLIEAEGRKFKVMLE